LEQDMHAVIMGGTSGIGLATAQLLATEGAEVTVTGRDPDRLAAVPEPIAAERLDGTDRAAVADFFARIGEFDHLVLAFSPGPVGLAPLRELTPEDLATAFEGKLFAYLDAIARAQVTGSITMISGASARAAVPGTVALSAVNGAIERVVSPLAVELAPVRVNAVSPGVIDTPWWASFPAAVRTEQFEAGAAAVPAGRVGTVEDVAAAVAYLVDAGFVTSTVLPVDGGYTLA
jgi:NAD(P)-dependent dehydrogenase (short-subunit alcohol dehydrogenase family)